MATMKTLNGYGFNATELNGIAASGYLKKTDTAADSSKLGGKAPSAYTQSVDSVPPDSAGNVPLNVVSGSRYYNDYTAGGTGDVDYITDTFAIVPISTDKNPDLFAALGSTGSWAYVKTSFYNKQETTSRRYQVAYSYNAIVQRKAFRTYTSAGWLGWQTDAKLSDVPRFNLLDNSNFAKPVVQAGLNGKHGRTAYLCDRWNAYSVTGEQKNGYIKLTGTSASSRITQNLDGVSGKTVTVAAKVTGSGLVYVGVYYTVDGTTTSVTKSVSAPNGIISVRGTIPSNAESIGFRIYPDNSGENLPANVYWAALYEGEYTDDNLPTYVPKGYAAELAECQRYYYRLAPTTSSYTYAYGYCYNETQARFNLHIPQAMVIENPTFLYTAGTYLRVVQNGTQKNITNLSLTATVGNHALIQATSESLTSSQTAALMMAGGVFEFIADL